MDLCEWVELSPTMFKIHKSVLNMPQEALNTITYELIDYLKSSREKID